MTPIANYINQVGGLIPQVLSTVGEHEFYGHQDYNQLYGLYEWTWFRGLGKKVKQARYNGYDRG